MNRTAAFRNAMPGFLHRHLWLLLCMVQLALPAAVPAFATRGSDAGSFALAQGLSQSAATFLFSKATTDAATQETGFGYGANGNRTSLVNRRDQTYMFTFDDANRLTSSNTPLLLDTGQMWTANDLLQTLTEPSGQAATLTYDDRLRVSSKTDPTGAISYGYDDNGNVLTVTEGAAVITRTYDARNRVLSATDAAGNTIGYQWDDAGNLTRLTYPGNIEYKVPD